MNEQRSSLHVILFLGMAGVAVIMVLMMISMDTLQHSAAGTRAKIASAVQLEYKFEDVVAEFVEGPKHKILQISYTTREYKKPEDREKQMKDVARFTYKESGKFEDQILFETLEVLVKRREVRGSGCFAGKDDHSFSLPLPKRVQKERGVEKPN